MEANSPTPHELSRERDSKRLLSSLIYAGKIALVDFGGELPNGNDIDPNFIIAVAVLGTGTVKLVQHLI